MKRFLYIHFDWVTCVKEIEVKFPTLGPFFVFVYTIENSWNDSMNPVFITVLPDAIATHWKINLKNLQFKA